MAFPAAGQDVPVPARRLGQGVIVVAQLAFLTSGKMRSRQLSRQPSVTLRPSGQHQQVRSWRIGILGAVATAERQLRAEHRLHLEFLGGLREPHHPVEAVVVGECDGPQIEPGGLLDELFRCAGAVEEAVRRMRMQLGVRDSGDGPLHIERLILPALA